MSINCQNQQRGNRCQKSQKTNPNQKSRFQKKTPNCHCPTNQNLASMKIRLFSELLSEDDDPPFDEAEESEDPEPEPLPLAEVEELDESALEDFPD